MGNKILMVDDDPDFVQAVTMLLEAKGYQVVTASNGEDGYAKAKAEKPNLISLDVMMANDSEGFDISKKLGADPNTKNIPVIIVSGIKKVQESAYDYESGEVLVPAKAFLEKPIDPHKFLQTVEKYIA